ncbi:MAG: Rrf2 family transcriptional regulator [Bacteroidetes bacterium]|nr:Rrf2 family transcriptional regulator [Bacteroidota bacterium]
MFSKSCQYAIRAVIYLTAHGREGQNTGVKEIAEALQVPQQFLAKILQELVRHHLLSSVKGPNGGFFLSEKNLKMSLLEVVECIDGKAVLTSCVLGLPQCSGVNPCPLHHQFVTCREGMREMLVNKKITEISADLLPQVSRF